MRHTIEELGEFAEENSDGGFSIWQVPHSCRGLSDPASKKWVAKIGEHDHNHYGATPDEAIKGALDAHDRNRNPDQNPDEEFRNGLKYYSATPKELEKLGHFTVR